MSQASSDLTCKESMPPLDSDPVVDSRRFQVRGLAQSQSPFLPINIHPSTQIGIGASRRAPSPGRQNGNSVVKPQQKIYSADAYPKSNVFAHAPTFRRVEQIPSAHSLQKPTPSEAVSTPRNFLSTLISEAVGPNLANYLHQPESLRNLPTAFANSELNRTVISGSLYKPGTSFSVSASSVSAHVNNVGIQRQAFSRPASAQKVDAPLGRSQTPHQPLPPTTPVNKGDFVSVPSNSANSTAPATALHSRSATPQQTNRDTRTPGPSTPTNSNNHAGANTHPSPRPSILRTSAVRRLVDKDSRPPSAAATVNLNASTSGRSSTPAPIGDNHVGKNNADAGGSLEDSPRKRMRKQQFDNSQFLQDQVKMMEASPEGADPSASTETSYPLAKPSEPRRRGRPRSNRSLMDRDESDASPRPYAPSPLHSDVASTSQAVRQTDSPVVKKRKYTRRLLGTDADASRKHLYRGGRPKKSEEWKGSRKNSTLSNAMRSMQPSASTDERNAVSVLFGLAQKTDNKNSADDANSDDESDNDSDIQEVDNDDDAEQDNDDKDEERVRVELDDLRTKFGDDFIDALKECETSSRVDFKTADKVNAFIQRAYHMRNDATTSRVGRKRTKNALRLPNCCIYQSYEEVKLLDEWLRLLPDAANYYAESQKMKQALRNRLHTLDLSRTLKSWAKRRISSDAESDGADSEAFEALGELGTVDDDVPQPLLHGQLKAVCRQDVLPPKPQESAPHRDLLQLLDVADCLDQIVNTVVRGTDNVRASTSKPSIVRSLGNASMIPSTTGEVQTFPALPEEEFNYSPSQLPEEIRRQISRPVTVHLGVFKRPRLKRRRREHVEVVSSEDESDEETEGKNTEGNERQERWSSAEAGPSLAKIPRDSRNGSDIDEEPSGKRPGRRRLAPPKEFPNRTSNGARGARRGGRGRGSGRFT